MANSIYHDIEGVGAVKFERSRRARRLNITIRPLRGVRVAVPFGVSLELAVALVRKRAAWIRKHLARIRELERAAADAGTSPVNTVEARRILAPRLDALARRHGFSYGRLTVRNQKTRWGSCSAANNISLNARLIRLSGDLRDYVILHELVHTRIKHHGPAFWDALDRLVGNSRELRKRLRRHPIELV